MKCDDNSFELNANKAENDQAMVGSHCIGDFITIEASSQGDDQQLEDRYCGGKLNNLNANAADAKIKDCTAPFEVGVTTDNAQDATPASGADRTNHLSGVCLEYTQEPCGASDQNP